MSRTAITDALSDWVTGVTKRNTVFDWQDRMGPRPDGNGCVILLGTTHSGFGDLEVEDILGNPPIPEPDITETARVQGTLFVSMNLFGKETLLDMNALRASVHLSQYDDLLSNAGLGFSRIGNILDLSAIVKNEPEPRHQAEWEFNIQTELSADIFSIESATITGNGTPVIVEKV